jgi:hypothetical protein
MKKTCAALILIGGSLVPCARAQSYGPEEQVLTIGAAEFQPLVSGDGLLHDDGYLYHRGSLEFVARLSLPEGALIEKICLYANDSDPGADVVAGLLATKLVQAGEAPYELFVGSNVSTSFNIGYGYECTGPFAYTIRARTDLDNDGTVDAVTYYVHALVPPPTQNNLGLGAVQISWRRAVSPPPPTPTFADVPAGDLGFPYVEALAASGITAGCAGGNYCPDATLTRRQMAVFLARAVGLHWTD